MEKEQPPKIVNLQKVRQERAVKNLLAGEAIAFKEGEERLSPEEGERMAQSIVATHDDAFLLANFKARMETEQGAFGDANPDKDMEEAVQESLAGHRATLQNEGLNIILMLLHKHQTYPRHFIATYVLAMAEKCLALMNEG